MKGLHPLLFLIVATVVPALAAVHYVPPGPAEAISGAISKAEPGDVIQLSPGVYTGTVDVKVSGEPENPIVISGLASGQTQKAVIDAGGEPGRKLTNQAFRFHNAAWVTVQDLDIRNAWTDVFQITDSSYLSILRCDIKGGMHVLSAQGAGTHHILAEGCVWVQDELIYLAGEDWGELHHGNLVHYNGGFYGGSGSDAAGGVVIRNNKIGYAFNGIRWWPGREAAEGRQVQSNIEIYDNYFHHIRDNSIEPELFTWNLHIYHNRLDSCPRGPVSIDGLAGGEILFYGNTGLWARDGAEEERPWTIYKFGNYGDEKKGELDFPLYLYNNSWHYGQAFVRGGKVRKANDHVHHFNNAYTFISPENHMGLNQWVGQNCRFDYDMAAAPWHPDLIAAGFEKNGIPDTDPRLRSVEENDFRLKADSPARGAGRVIEDFHLWYLGDGLDIGAYQGEQRTYGMPFVHRDPPGGSLYEEKPRVVRIFKVGDELAVFFSTQIDADTLNPGSIRLNVDGGSVSVRSARIPDPAYAQAVVLTLEEALPESAEIVSLTFAPELRGVNGQPATTWAADLRLVRVPRAATLVGLMDRLFPDRRPESPTKDSTVENCLNGIACCPGNLGKCRVISIHPLSLLIDRLRVRPSRALECFPFCREKNVYTNPPFLPDGRPVHFHMPSTEPTNNTCVFPLEP